MRALAAWWRGLRRSRDERIVDKRPIPDALWRLTLARYPFLAALNDADQAELRRLSTLFLARKEFHGAHGFAVTDDIAVAIAAQACLPILRLDLGLYDDFVGIVVHADEVVARREVMDEDGIVHEYDETLTGEAMEGGPIMLSWHDVAEAGESAEVGYNVVIHEFAHVLDLRDGAADGVPLLPTQALRNHWTAVLDAEFRRFCDEVDAGMETVVDPYGASGVDEFFAVAVEHFFVAPDAFAQAHAALYELFCAYFDQRPAERD